MALTQSNRPTCLIFSRQALPTLDRSLTRPASGTQRGAYVLTLETAEPDILLLASGSEVSLALAAARRLSQTGIKARVISMPAWSVFEEQDEAYKEEVLPRHIKARLAIEQAASFGWDRYVGLEGDTVTMHSFGSSAPIAKLQEKFGFTIDHVCERATGLLTRLRGARKESQT